MGPGWRRSLKMSFTVGLSSINEAKWRWRTKGREIRTVRRSSRQCFFFLRFARSFLLLCSVRAWRFILSLFRARAVNRSRLLTNERQPLFYPFQVRNFSSRSTSVDIWIGSTRFSGKLSARRFITFRELAIASVKEKRPSGIRCRGF